MLPVNMSVEEFVRRARRIYLSTESARGWEDIIRTTVRGNTARSLRPEGTLDRIRAYLIRNKERIVRDLHKVRSRVGLNKLVNRWRRGILNGLKNDNKSVDQITPYNKLRKPIDLYLSALISMAEDFRKPPRQRRRLLSWLSLPLDSQILANPAVFTVQELQEYNLTRRSTYGDITDRTTYNDLQRIVRKRAKRINKLHKLRDVPFYPVFFDMFWNDNYRIKGRTWSEVRERSSRGTVHS